MTLLWKCCVWPISILYLFFVIELHSVFEYMCLLDIIEENSMYITVKIFAYALFVSMVFPLQAVLRMFPLSQINTRRKVTTFSIKVIFRYYFIIFSMRLCKQYVKMFELFINTRLLRFTLPFYCIVFFVVRIYLVWSMFFLKLSQFILLFDWVL